MGIMNCGVGTWLVNMAVFNSYQQPILFCVEMWKRGPPVSFGGSLLPS